MTLQKIAVLSAGNGGQALAADLTIQGHNVSLYDLPKFADVINKIKKNSNQITLKNKLEGTATLELVTTNMQEAVSGRKVIFFVAPSFAQAEFFELLLPCLSDGQIVVLMPGNYGALTLHNLVKNAGKKCLIAETDNLPYACAIDSDGKVDVRGIKKQVALATCPARYGAEVAEQLKGSFSSNCVCVVAQNVLETSMSSLNMLLHCGPMLANAARVESSCSFEFYYEGVTESVSRLIEAADQERLNVAAAYNLKLASAKDVLKAQYGLSADTLYEVIKTNPAFAGKAPKSLYHRFLTEDTPSSLIPLCALGKIAAVPTPTLDALALLINLLLDVDYYSTGQTALAMGFEGLDKGKILKIVSE